MWLCVTSSKAFLLSASRDCLDGVYCRRVCCKQTGRLVLRACSTDLDFSEKLLAGVYCRSACCDPEGRIVMRACGANVEMWDMRMHKKVYTEMSHTGDVQCVKMLNDGAWVVSAGADCTVRLWSVAKAGSGMVHHAL